MATFRIRWATALFLAIGAPAGAADFIPTRYDDPVPGNCVSDDCSLREAVIAVNEGDGSDRILLSAGIYQLSLIGANEDFAATGDLDLRQDVEILGAGATMTRIDATGLGDSAIHGVGVATPVATLRGLAVQNASRDGMSLQSGTYTIEECEFVGNGALTNGHGVALTIGSTATIRRSTFSGNVGIGLSVTQGSATIQNSTFSGNGGAEVLVNSAAAWSCTHCTIFDAADPDPELSVQNSTAFLSNSIVRGGCFFNASGSLSTLGGNLEAEGNTCFFLDSSDQHDVLDANLLLGVLQGNGGSTSTHLVQAGSAALGSAVEALCLEDDQRGVVRSTACESGALEVTSDPVATPVFRDGFQQEGAPAAWSATVN